MSTNKSDRTEVCASDLEVIKYSQRLFVNAAQAADKCLRQSEDSTITAHARLELLGEAAYVLRLVPMASRHFHASYMMEPCAVVAARLALCAYRQNELAQAEEWITRAIGSEPAGKLRALALEEEVSFMGIYATVLIAAGRPEEALAVANKALQAWPKDAVAAAVRADSRMLTGSPSQAIDDYSVAIGLSEGEVKADLLSRRQVAEGMAHATKSGAAFVAKSVAAAARHV